MMLIQSQNSNSPGASSVGMSCLRARNITSGSKKVDNVPGAGNRVVFGGWALLVVMAAMGLLL